MVSYRVEEFSAYHGLRKIVFNSDKPDEVKKVAERVLNDKILFKQFVQNKVDKKIAIQEKKVLENAKKDLTGWKKWFKMILPRSLIIG